MAAGATVEIVARAQARGDIIDFHEHSFGRVERGKLVCAQTGKRLSRSGSPTAHTGVGGLLIVVLIIVALRLIIVAPRLSIPTHILSKVVMALVAFLRQCWT